MADDLQANTRTLYTDIVGLPVKNNLKLASILSIGIAILMAVVSVVGIIYRSFIYQTDELVLAFVPIDIFNIIVGLPILLGSVRLAWRGKLIGLLCWPGALFYVLYIFIPYLLGVPFNLLFLPYLILVILSAYTLIGLVASIDGERVRQRLTGLVPARTSAGILFGLATFILFRQTVSIVTTLPNQTSVDAIELATWIADFALPIPMLLVGGIQLWRRQTLGYVAGAGLLLGYALLALSLIPYFVFRARYTASQVDVAGIVAVLTMAAVCVIPFAFFVRVAATNRTTLSTFQSVGAIGETRS